MKTLLSIAFVAVAAVAVSASGAHADNANGSCNRIVANAMNASQVCWNFGCDSDACMDVAMAAGAFFGNDDCAAGFTSGELEGLTNSAALQPEGAPNAGEAKHIAEVICNAVAECGLCMDGQGPLGECAGFCPVPM
ncbi:MAG: hypothetical protein OEM15_01185 [Myxococcales bacterium]|nr:hypothetical protein [Myxococcales bacterium]MDH3483745.1 hypothetical protein [Myxococcales bacterium]